LRERCIIITATTIIAIIITTIKIIPTICQVDNDELLVKDETTGVGVCSPNASSPDDNGGWVVEEDVESLPKGAIVVTGPGVATRTDGITSLAAA
jgi:hypothetical protein